MGKKDKTGMQHRFGQIAPVAAPRWCAFAVIVAILALYVALRLPGISVPLDRDEGAFGYIGQRINEGGLPYREAVDHKPPVAFYINALALNFAPPTEGGIHTFLLVYNFLTLVCVFFIGNAYFRSLSAGLWCAFAYDIVSSSPAVQGFTASTEMWMLLPMALSLLLAIHGVRRKSPALLFMSGVAGAVACWTKQSAFTGVLFVFVYAGLSAFSVRENARRVRLAEMMRTLLWWLAGACMFSALLALYFSAHGIFREFYYWSFLHNVSYAGNVSMTDIASGVRMRLTDIAAGDGLLLASGILVAAASLVRKRSEGIFVLGFLLLSFLGTIPGYGYKHYFAQIAPAAAIAGGYAFHTLAGRCTTFKARLAASILCGLAALALPLAVNRQYYFRHDPAEISRLAFGYNPFPESKALAKFVAGATSPADKIFIMGSEPQILFYAERRSATSIIMFYPLMSSYPRYREFQEKIWAELQKDPPKYVLSVLDLSSSFCWDGKADLKFLDRINQWLKDEYEMDRVMLVTGLNGEWTAIDDGRLREGGPMILVRKRKA